MRRTRLSLFGLVAGLFVLAPAPVSAQISGDVTTNPGQVLKPDAVDHVGLFGQASHYFDLRMQGRWMPSRQQFHFGSGARAFAGYLAVAGDWNGDGRDTVGYYEYSTGSVKLARRNQSSEPAAEFTISPLMWAVAGDWDADGVDTLGGYNWETGLVELWNSHSGGAPDVSFTFGPYQAPGPQVIVPVAGDFDGDGVDTIGAYDISTSLFRLRNLLSTGGPTGTFNFGTPGYPVFGDWDGDGRDTVGLFDITNRVFRLRNLNNNGSADLTIPHGSAMQGWWPIAGRWDRRNRKKEHTGYDWPLSTPAAESMDVVQLDQAADIMLGWPRWHSLLVVRNGKLVYERYSPGWDGTKGNCVKSTSKSILAAAYGRAWEQGHIPDLNATVESYLPAYFVGQDPAKSNITIAQMMTMTAGLEWDEVNSVGPLVGSPDWGQWIIDQPLVSTPGAFFNYSTGLTHIASILLETATGMPTRDYVQQEIYDPLGISFTRWDDDPQGYDFGGAEVWVRPRDMARFGQVILDDGVADGQQVLHPDWVATMTAELVNLGGPFGYGLWWWRDNFAGETCYYTAGWGGQLIFVFDSLDMVVVTTAAWWGGTNEPGTTTNLIYDTLRDYIVPSAN